MSSALALEAATKTYVQGGEVIQALDAVTMSLEPGELVALTGPSGSGKTTLLSLLCGWTNPDAGVVRIQSGATMPDAVPWSELSLVPQALGLLDDLSIEENVKLPLRWLDLPAGAHTVAELLDMFGLGHLAARIPPDTSLGEQQRTAIARALVAQPAVILADEPSAHQDAAWTNEVFYTLRRIADEGAACLVATHDPAALAVADRVLRLEAGHLTQE
jgi:putative ABC transport system ATP-binding protein